MPTSSLSVQRQESSDQQAEQAGPLLGSALYPFASEAALINMTAMISE
jgi:hypothetical protein